jgi:hypothetical protein
MSKMYRVTTDCICTVEQIGVKLRNVVPDYLRVVKGDLMTHDLPKIHEFRRMLKNFVLLNARFNGRTEDGKRLPKGPDRRATEHELMALAEIGQYLVSLHEIKNYHESGLPPKGTVWSVDLNNWIIKETVFS